MSVSFPFFLSLVDSKDAWVRDLCCGPEKGEGWKSSFSRHFNNWELEEVERFLSHIEREAVVNELEDKLKWEKTKKSVYSVKSLYLTLRPRAIDPFPWTLVWKTCFRRYEDIFFSLGKLFEEIF